MPYWTTDIGAFFVKRGAPWYWRGDFDRCFDDLGYRELFTRWYQWAVFLPVFRGHGTDCRRELWYCANDDVPFYDVIIKMNRMRYELMPYIYSAAANCWVKDGTIMLPLAFDYPDDAIANKITDQYMFGDSLMVCPVTEPMYYLPGSKKMEAEKTRNPVSVFPVIPYILIWRFAFHVNPMFPFMPPNPGDAVFSPLI